MTDQSETRLYHAELESEAHTIVGGIVFEYSRFELNLGLCLRMAVGHGDPNAVNPLINRLSYKSKLDAVVEVVEHKFASDPECISEFKKWHKKMDGLRLKRNSFVHGRWGILWSSQQIANVRPGMPGPSPLGETRYSLLMNCGRN